jgi:hypothetical protein
MTNNEIKNQDTNNPNIKETKQATLPKTNNDTPTSKNPKILVACPTFSRYTTYLDEYLKGIESIDYDAGSLVMVDYSQGEAYATFLRHKGIRVLKAPYTGNQTEDIKNARNLIRNFFLKGDYDYLFSLDQNIIPPANVLKQLLSHKKDIVGAYYGEGVKLKLEDNQTKEIITKVIELPPIYIYNKDKQLVQANALDIRDKGLVKVVYTAFGCLLIKRNVLENISFRTDKDTNQDSEQIFCSDAVKFGHEIYVDGSVIAKAFPKIKY